MKGSNLTVTGGTIITPDATFNADIRIIDGKIEKIGNHIITGNERVVDASGLFVLPGVIDSHVHMRDPGLTESEDFRTGTAAAAAGGVTTILDMPNTLPPVDTETRFREKRDLVAPKATVDFGLFGVIHDANLANAQELINSGAVGLKVFMGPSTGDIPSPSDATIYEALLLSKKFGFPVAFHAEDGSMVKYYTEMVKKSGRIDPLAHCDSRPNICETEAINRAAYLTLQSGGRGHIVHVSTREGVRLASEYRKQGASITCESTPHHLSMTRQDQERYGSLAKINPPLRTRDDQAALWDGISSGIIDTLGSDHSPHPAERKRNPNIWEAPSGFVGVETIVPVMLDFSAASKISLQTLAVMLSESPARVYGLYPKKRNIGLNADGDLTIVDLSKERVIRAEELHSKQKVTPFEGRVVKGTVKYTIVRGNVVYDGEIGRLAGELVTPISANLRSS